MSLRILAFNTSTVVCSVALMIDDVIRESCVLNTYHHEKHVLLMIDRLLVESGVELRNLDFLVFCQGPGSFVGTRIGVSLAQGLALGADLPVIQVSSLKTLAQGMWRLTKAQQVLTTINARLGELYWACYYRQKHNVWLCKSDESITSPEGILMFINTLNGSWALVGTGWENYAILSSDIIQITTRKILLPSARDMFPLALEYWKSGYILTVNEIQPVYLYQIK